MAEPYQTRGERRRYGPKGDLHLHLGRDASPRTCWSGSCATSASTRSPSAIARRARVRRASSTSRGCSSRSCWRSGLEDAALDEQRLRDRDAARRRARRRPDRPRRHEPGRAGRGRRADRAPRLRRLADRAAARRHRARSGEMPLLARPPATTSSPPAATRCSAPTTRPAWPRSWPRSPTSPRTRSCPRPHAAGLLHARRGDRRGRDAVRRRGFGAVCAYTLDGSDLGELQDETFAAEEVTLTIHGVDAHPGWANGHARQRRAAGGRDRSPRCRAELTPERTERPRGLHPPLRGRRRPAGAPSCARSCATSTTTSSPRTPRCCARTAEEVVAREPARAARGRGHAAVPEHAPLHRAVPAGRGERPSARSGPRASSRSARRSAAAPTAHG